MKTTGFLAAAAAAVIVAATAGTAMADSTRDHPRKRHHYSHSYTHPPRHGWGDAPAASGWDYGPRGRGPAWMERNSVAAYKRQQEMQWQSDGR